MVFFRMVHNEKLFRRCSVKLRTFSENPTWSNLFFLFIKKWKVAVNCTKIVAYMVKVVICLVLKISKQQYPSKKQYPWCLKLKLLDLVWVGIWGEGHGTLLLPQWLRPSYWTSKLLGYIPENRSLFDNFKGREDVE